MKKIIIFIAFVSLSTLSFAGTIKLKSGDIVEGKIVERSDDEIKVDIGIGINTTYYLDEIESIDGEEVVALSEEDVSEGREALEDVSAEETSIPEEDTLYLKSGEEVKGNIKYDTNISVGIEINGMLVEYQGEDVARIEKSSAHQEVLIPGSTTYLKDGGSFRGKVVLPEGVDIADEGGLYLIIGKMGPDMFATDYVKFSPDEIKQSEVAYKFSDLADGYYWIKAILDNAKPFVGDPDYNWKNTQESMRETYKNPAQMIGAWSGDYTKMLSPIKNPIAIKGGNDISDVNIDGLKLKE